jgi:hypothetical protein
MVVLEHFDAKRFAEIAGSALEHNAMPRRGSFDDFESVRPSKAFNFSQFIGVGTVMELEVFARKIPSFPRKAVGQGLVSVQLGNWTAGSKDHRDFDLLLRVSRADDVRTKYGNVLAPIDPDVSAARGHISSSFSPGQGGTNGNTASPDPHRMQKKASLAAGRIVRPKTGREVGPRATEANRHMVLR